MKKYLSINIGGTKVKYALMQADGHILRKNSIDFVHDKGKFLQNLDQIIAQNEKCDLAEITL